MDAAGHDGSQGVVITAAGTRRPCRRSIERPQRSTPSGASNQSRVRTRIDSPRLRYV